MSRSEAVNSIQSITSSALASHGAVPLYGEWLPTNQLKSYTGRSAHRWKVDRMNGIGPAYVLLAGRVYYRRADLDAYMTSHLIQPRKAA